LGEEHVVSLLPRWENQIIRVRESFGREMIPDDSQPVEDGVIFVKSADGSPPDALFERIMCYTFGDDPTEHHIRVHKENTPALTREGLKKLHPGVVPTAMLIEGAEVDDEWPMADLMTRTGKSDIKVSWKMEQPRQKFWLWAPAGEVDLGDEDLVGQPPEDMWKSLKRRNPDLGRPTEYGLATGQEEIH
jgi:hypothetical protein